MPTVWVAIPAMDELDYLPVTLNALSCQQIQFPFEVYVCVNQPDEYWNHSAERVVCEHNRALLDYLSRYDSLPLHVLDYSSPGKGWKGKKSGVGFARKVLFECILTESSAEDIIVSLDADTWIGPTYLQSIVDNFESHPTLNALAVPYYHDVNFEEDEQSRAMLRYEIYMRNYAINLLKIGSPYGFTALGSAIAMRAGALQKIGNITPYQSGEDFYLVQKFSKMGGLSLFNTQCVHPAGRYSNRVPFGTGPAMLQGASNRWDSYPIYSHVLFQPIAEAYAHLADLYAGNYPTEKNDFLVFLQKNKDHKDIWEDIRRNVSDYPHFVKAFHQKADGLRILQYVRSRNPYNLHNESIIILDNLKQWMSDNIPSWLSAHCPLASFSVEQLDSLRNMLFHYEQKLRERYHNTSTNSTMT